MPGTGASQDAVIERLHVIVQILGDCTGYAKPLNLSGDLDGVTKRINDRITKLGTSSEENSANLPSWDADSAKQRDLLTRAANGLKLASSQAKSAGAGAGAGGGKVQQKAEASSFTQMLVAPALDLGRAWIDVASVSDLPDTAAPKLAAAETREKLFPVEVTETILNYVRTLLASVKSAGGASNKTYSNAAGMAAKEQELSKKAIELRSAFETDPAKGQQMLATMQDDIDTLVLEASMTNTVAQLDVLTAQLADHHDSILEKIMNPATLRKDSESGGHLRGNRARMEDCMEWVEIFRDRVNTEVKAPFSTGTKDGIEKAKAAFEAYKSDETVKEHLEFAADVIEDAEFVAAVTAIAAMLVIGLVSGGLGDIAGAAVVGSEEALVTVGGVAVTTGAVVGAGVESFTATVMSAAISKEPTGAVALAESFFTNFAFAAAFKTVGTHFADVKKFTDAERTASKVASFGAMYIGMTFARCQEKRAAKGSDLTDEEMQDIAVETAAELVGQALAMHALHHFCDDLQAKLTGVREFEEQLGEINKLRDEVHADAQALADNAKATPAAQLGAKMKATIAKSDVELQAEEKFLHDLDQVMNAPGAEKLFTPEEISKIHSALGDTKRQLYQQRKMELLSGKTAVAPNHYEIAQGSMPEVIAKVQEMGGWHQMEITEETKGGPKTVRFEPNRGDDAPPDGHPEIMKFTEVSSAAAAKPADITPEAWGSACKSISAGACPKPTEIPATPENLQAQRKLEMIVQDPHMQSGDLRSLRNDFFRELAAKLDPKTPDNNIDTKIQEVLKTPGPDGNPKYLRRGPAVSAAAVQKLGGVYRAVTFDTLLGNHMVTNEYYLRLIDGHASEGFPATLDGVGWSNETQLKALAGLMRSTPPGANDFDKGQMIQGYGGASGWWYAGEDEHGASTAAALSKALAASNMANGVVVFELPPEIAAGTVPADVAPGPVSQAKIVARKPLAFDGATVRNSQFNANPDTNAPTGLTTPEPGSPQSKVREVVIPPVAMSSTKWPPRVMP